MLEREFEATGAVARGAAASFVWAEAGFKEAKAGAQKAKLALRKAQGKNLVLTGDRKQ